MATKKAASKKEATVQRRLRGSKQISLVTATKLLASFILVGGTEQGVVDLIQQVPKLSEKTAEAFMGAWGAAHIKAAEIMSYGVLMDVWAKQPKAKDQIARTYVTLRAVRYGYKMNISPEQNDKLFDEALTMAWESPLIVKQRKYLYSISKNSDDAKIEEWKTKMRDAVPEIWSRAMGHARRAAVIKEMILKDIEMGN